MAGDEGAPTETSRTDQKNENDADMNMNVDEDASPAEQEAARTSTQTQNPPKDLSKDEVEEPKAVGTDDKAADPQTATSSVHRTWDRTNCKVIVHAVDQYLNPAKIKKLTERWLSDPDFSKTYPDCKIVKTKKPPRDSWMQVTLNSVDYVQPFIELLETKKFVNKKGRTMYATTVDNNTSSDGLTNNKRGGDGDSNGRDNKRPRREENDATSTSSSRDVRDVVTPLWKLPYSDQLQTKQKQMITKCVVKAIKEIKNKFRQLQFEAKRNPKNVNMIPVYDWLKEKQPIHAKEILPAPGLLRNKCEFNFGYLCASEELPVGQEATQRIPAVGFHANGWAGGVSPPHSCQNIPDAACTIAELLNDFLQRHPELPPYDSKVHRGFWRIVTIRTSPRTGQCMVVLVHGPVKGGVGTQDESDDYTSIFEACKQELIELLTQSNLIPKKPRNYGDERQPFPPDPAAATRHPDDQPIRVTSIFFQEYHGLSHPSPDTPVQHVYGQTAMEEILGQCRFRISPGAFFQVNTAGAENLYQVVVDKVREVTQNNKDPSSTVLLDVCCGTGTIGLTCMKEGVCGKVVGVDISEPAIADAKQNATLNGYTDAATTRFVAGRAEHVLQEESRALRKTEHLVAVVDPAREGLHPTVVRTLRLNKAIQRIVYVSCNPTGSFLNDAGLLCGPPSKKYGGIPFAITSAQPVDMFPLTDHCEMVFTFDRIPSASSDDTNNKSNGKDAKKEDADDGQQDEKKDTSDESKKEAEGTAEAGEAPKASTSTDE